METKQILIIAWALVTSVLAVCVTYLCAEVSPWFAILFIFLLVNVSAKEVK